MPSWRGSRREVKRRKGKVFAFVGAKGGVGTTTAVVNLGAHMQREGMQTLLVDLHLAFGNLADHLDMSPVPYSTANLALLHPEAITEAAVEQHLLAHPSELKLLASSPTVPFEITFSPEHLAAIVQQAAYQAQIVLLDLPTDPDVIESVAGAVDGIVLVLGSEPSSLRAAENIATHLHHLNLYSCFSTLIVHRYKPTPLYVSDRLIYERLGIPTLGLIPAHPDLYLQAEQNRTPVLLMAPDQINPAIYSELSNRLLNYVPWIEAFHHRQMAPAHNQPYPVA